MCGAREIDIETEGETDEEKRVRASHLGPFLMTPSALRVAIGLPLVECLTLLAIMSYEIVYGYAPLRTEVVGFVPHSTNAPLIRLFNQGLINKYALCGRQFIHSTPAAWTLLGFDAPAHITDPTIYTAATYAPEPKAA